MSATVTSPDQAKADAFARHARFYAEIAAANRASSAAPASLTTSQWTGSTTAALPPVPRPAISPGVSAAAAKLEAQRQKTAALADRLGMNAQRLATFHLARVGQVSTAPGNGGPR